MNLAKNELGKISKIVSEKINVSLSNSLNVNQWKNTQEVFVWFKSIGDKQHYTFIMFDIKDCYPPISKEPLTNPLTFTETINSE